MEEAGFRKKETEISPRKRRVRSSPLLSKPIQEAKRFHMGRWTQCEMWLSARWGFPRLPLPIAEDNDATFKTLALTQTLSLRGDCCNRGGV